MSTPPLDRVQLALHVPDLTEAIAFYRDLFATEPHKVRPGYANFSITRPPLKLALLEDPSRAGGLDHLGVERSSTEAVEAEARRLEASGHVLRREDGTVCCHARQDKHWITDPGSLEWENYVVTDDAPEASAAP
ncbi:VOC family protein [Nocardioidaceae bacterium]|nr:VOC family protein [Nocardioidaceae bacterium]